jgi:hypothetical protein
MQKKLDRLGILAFHFACFVLYDVVPGWNAGQVATPECSILTETLSFDYVGACLNGTMVLGSLTGPRKGSKSRWPLPIGRAMAEVREIPLRPEIPRIRRVVSAAVA